MDSGTSLSSKEVTPRDGVIDGEDKDADMKKEIEEKLDIDLEDPDVVKATTKIQAGFRGSMARKSLKQGRENIIEEKVEEEENKHEEEDASDEEEGESEYEDSEEEEEVVGTGKNTFVLLKQLVGIMKLGAGPKIAASMQKETGDIDDKTSDKLENGNGASEVINGGVNLPNNKSEDVKGNEVNGDASFVGNGKAV